MKFFSLISKPEWRIVALVAAAMVVLTGAPYVYGYFSAPVGYTYTGLHALSPGDIPVYYSYINQIKRGKVVMRDLFTSEPQDSGLFNVWWFVVGNFARLFDLPAALAFQLSRLFMVGVAVFGIYVWVSNFFVSSRQRLGALVFALCSAGVGVYAAPWLMALDPSSALPAASTEPYRWPIDLWIGESTVFNSLYQTSHFIVSLLLLLIIFSCFVVASESSRVRWGLLCLAGVAALFECNFHPYYAPLIFGVMGVYWCARCLQEQKILWRPVLACVIVGVFSIPSLAYHVWVLATQPVLAARALQNVTPIAPLGHVILGYGFLLLGGLVGLTTLLKNRLSAWWVLVVSWLGVASALLFIPNQFQSRYTQGVQMVLSLLAVYAFVVWWPKLSGRWRVLQNKTLVMVVLTLAFGLTSLFQLARDVYYFKDQPEAVKKYLYISNDLQAAIAWLAVQSPAVVFSSPQSASFIAAATPHQVFAAHGHETIDYQNKATLVRAVFGNQMSPSEVKSLLSSSRVQYVVYGEHEKALGDFAPSQQTFLKPVFSNNSIVVYQVVSE